MVLCAAFGCNSLSGREKVNFFRFPKDKKLRKVWCNKIGRANSASKYKVYSPNKNSRLCSLHFEEDQFTHSASFLETIGFKATFRRTLKTDAVPTIFSVTAGKRLEIQKKRRLSSEVLLEKKRKNQVNSEDVDFTSFVLTHPTKCDVDHSYSILSGCIRPNEPSPEYMRKFDDIICDFLREQGVPGASLCIKFQGKPIYKQGYGINCGGELVSSSSHYRIASISKVLTAIAVLRLCEDRLLSLEDKVFGQKGILKGIKQCRQKMLQSDKITVRHLLEHSAGWDRDLEGDHVFWYQKDKHRPHIDTWNNISLVEYVLTHNLTFKPGTRHAYSNLGYLVLGMVIEEVTGMKYEDYVRSVLRSIGIEDIRVGKTKQEKVHYEEVKYYNNKYPQVESSVLGVDSVVAPQYGSFPMENSGAYGGWVTCAENLVTILDSLIQTDNMPSILSAASVSEMLEAPGFEEEEDWYGLGLDINNDGASFGHTGAMEGTSATVYHDKSGLTWSLLLNSWAKDMDLDSLIKYALSTVQGLPLWSGIDFRYRLEEHFVISADKVECVTILLPRKRFIENVIDMKARGYIISWINALPLTDDVQFNIIWRKQRNPAEWSVIIDVELQDFDNCLTKIKNGWQVVALESYCLNGKVYHMFVFKERCNFQQKIYVVNSFEKHTKFKTVYEVNKYQLQSQAVLEVDKDLYISAVYNQVPEQDSSAAGVWFDLPLDDFVSELAKCIENRLELNYLKFYTTEGLLKISAVWHQGYEQKNLFQRYDVTKYGFLFELGESLKCNRPVSFISAYTYEDITYFVAVWQVEVRHLQIRDAER